MKEKTFFGLLALSVVLVVAAAFLKIEHVANANFALMAAMAFQFGTIGYFIVWSLFFKKTKSWKNGL